MQLVPIAAQASSDVHTPRGELSSSSTTSERVVVIGTLGCVLAALLRRSFMLARGVDRTSRRSSSLTEPLVPPRLKADSDLYQLLERHKNAQNALRCQALDAFRGLTLCLMVFVNYGGGGFAVCTHSAWDGLTVADLVFPWFAWILGFSLFLSSSSRRDESIVRTFAGIGQRTIKLFVLGLFINNGDSWSDWRIPGVLQALSAAYLIVAVADWGLSRRPGRIFQQYHVSKFVGWHFMCGVIPLVFLNLVLTFKLPVPGCPTGYIGPGGLADDGAYRNCTGGAHLYVDTLVFGRQHLFQTPTCQQRYQTGPYDPEGLLNWLMVATTAYIGYLQGALFMITQELSNAPTSEVRRRQIRNLVVCGSALVLLSVVSGGLWAFPRGPWIPLNKNLWSLSYVQLSSGLAAWLLALLVKLIDGAASVKWWGTACIAVGRNSIALYIMHEVCQHFAPFSPKPLRMTEEITHLEVLLYNLVGVVTWVVVAQWLDLHEIFIKI
ncbi:Heparan-alpha-glucosaminide N-acetyltransferase [Phytophthora cinnamomi]|uniref:Heparan-alpha-glucosaminide N-acetyltransferase n=1 Tax=Phytophthora cinnamomi TaxID=4785 RepID=UPI00355A85B1|nr:Heparan-alpha-glucosaminide N-acetyltransferase [Phytophthora cinnamomi]